MIITIDLDDVIFDTRPLYRLAFESLGQPFVKCSDWNLYKCYGETVANRLFEVFKDDCLYTMPLLDKRIPGVLNQLIHKPNLDILFVTQRILKQPQKTFQQLINAGIQCSFDQVYDQEGEKSDILIKLKTNLHFDDSPHVISQCINKNIPICMISNNYTQYNYYLRKFVPYSTNLYSGLIQYGIYTR